MNKYLVLSPSIEQSAVIANFIKEYSTSIVLGALLGEEKEPRLKVYAGFIRINDADLAHLMRDYTIVPTGARATKWLLDRIPSCKLGEIIYDNENIKIFNKLWMLDVACKAGVPIPETYQDAEEIKNYPIFYKQAYERGFGPRGVIFKKKELEKLNKDGLIFQEYIPGAATYGVGFLAAKGEVLTSYCHKELLSAPPEGGCAAIIEPFYDPGLIGYAAELIKRLNYSGWGLAEFKYCSRRKDFIFMEINAKFWASCEFSFINNPSFLEYLFGIKIKEKPVKGMIFLDRLLANGVGYLIGNLKFLKSCKIRYYSNPIKRYIACHIFPKVKNLIRKDAAK